MTLTSQAIGTYLAHFSPGSLETLRISCYDICNDDFVLLFHPFMTGISVVTSCMDHSRMLRQNLEFCESF